MSKQPEKPIIRVLHHMARSGGTIISRCLASMSDIALLSEIHPMGVRNPFEQAVNWHALFTAEEIHQLLGQSFTFVDTIEMIRLRCEHRGKYLIIRDWTHLDFVGLPFIEQPSYQLVTAGELKTRFQVIQATTVRHPIDQWLSLIKLEGLKDDARLKLDRYLQGYVRFAEQALQIGFVRFEDFAADSDKALKSLCQRLQVPFDVGYKERWFGYRNITGDTITYGQSRFTESRTINVPPRQAVDPAVIMEFKKDPNYAKALELLNYED